MSFVAALAVSIPAIATIALMLVIVSVAPAPEKKPQKLDSKPVIEASSGSGAREVKRREISVSSPSTLSEVQYHIIFSTGCSIFQDWQSYVFFYNAMTSGQPGTVTRIVSGCSKKDQDTLQKLFDEQIANMVPGDRFRIHFTPDFSNQKKGANYKYWNKPFGTKHWMEHALGFPEKPQNEDAIVILLDPDQMITRPFRNNDFSNTRWIHLKEGVAPRTRIEHGKPMGQFYGFSLQWKHKIDMSKVVPNEKSPVDELSQDEAKAGYIVGPPYIATARDMYAIVSKWCEFAVPVHDQYPHLLAEMFAYCLAAAHLRLAHQTAASFMVSDVGTGDKSEGWGYIGKLPNNELCHTHDPERLPNVIHFCQRYGIDHWFFGKYRLPKNFISCDHPLMLEPPNNLLETGKNQVVWPGGGISIMDAEEAKKNAFMACQMIRALNSAAEHFKKSHCHGQGNFNKTYTFHPSHNFS